MEERVVRNDEAPGSKPGFSTGLPARPFWGWGVCVCVCCLERGGGKCAGAKWESNPGPQINRMFIPVDHGNRLESRLQWDLNPQSS